MQSTVLSKLLNNLPAIHHCIHYYFTIAPLVIHFDLNGGGDGDVRGRRRRMSDSFFYFINSGERVNGSLFKGALRTQLQSIEE